MGGPHSAPCPPSPRGDAGSVSDRGKGKPWQGRGSLRLESPMGKMQGKNGSETEFGYKNNPREEKEGWPLGH